MTTIIFTKKEIDQLLHGQRYLLDNPFYRDALYDAVKPLIEKLQKYKKEVASNE